MSHETHNETHKGGEPASKTSMRSSFWLVIILVLLFIAALRFVDVMGEAHHGEHGGGAHTEATGGHGHEAEINDAKSATATGTMEGETGLGKDTEHSGAKAASDTVQNAHH